MTAFCPGLSPSTSIPKICWVFGAVVDLKPRFLSGVLGKYDQDPAVERRGAQLGPELDMDLEAWPLLPSLGVRPLSAGTKPDQRRNDKRSHERDAQNEARLARFHCGPCDS